MATELITSQKKTRSCINDYTLYPHDSLKSSFYNYFIKYDEDSFFGYNFLYRSILRVPADAFPLVDQFLTGLSSAPNGSGRANTDLPALPSQWIDALKEVSFVIDKKFDEISLIKFRYFRSLYANDSLCLVVLPTLWCNLACPYCFEEKKLIFMRKENEDALIRWIEKNFRNKKHIFVSWFGGEPLIAKGTIFRVTRRLQEFCKSIGADYTASLTTNGYYLDKKFIDSVASLNINQVQVTMDGDKAAHDKLKKKRNGGGSFDRVFQNIITFCEKVPDSDCKLALRINCCDDNYDSIERLLERFPPAVRSHAIVFFRWVYANKASGYREFSHNKGTEPFNGMAKLYAIANKLNWRTQIPSASEFDGYCEVDFIDHYTIDPESNVFLCSDSYEKSESIGSLLDVSHIRPDVIGDFTRWYSLNPFNDEECLSCQLLPVCSGGCRKARFNGSRMCIDEKISTGSFVRCLVEKSVTATGS